MPQVALENLIAAGAGLALLLYLGAGLSAWLPHALAPYRRLAAPWVGYSLLVVTTQFLTNWPFALTALQSGYVAAGIATAVNVIAAAGALRRRQAAQVDPSLPNSISYEGRGEALWVALIVLGVFVLGVLPLWSYGYTTVIGENWDAEIYVGLGEYLKVYSQLGLGNAVPNPILDTLINPPYSLRTHGFSYFQAALGVLPLDSLRTLAPTLALMRALSIPAAYMFFRVGMGLRTGASLMACGVLGVNAFLLWVTYNTFGMQVPALGLLPLSVCATLVALDAAGSGDPLLRSWAPALWAGLFLAAMAITYHPALTAYAAMVGPVALVMLIRRRKRSLRVLGSLMLVGLVGALLSLVSQLKSLDGFLKQYGERTGGLGLTGFTSPGDALGFSLSFRELLPADPGRPLLSLVSKLYDLAGWAALVAGMALVALYVFGLWSRRSAAPDAAWWQSALLAGAVAYALLFVRPLDYPYGWFKALSFISFVLVGAVVGALWELVFGTSPAPRSAYRLGAVVGAGLLAMVLATTVLTVRLYWGEPLRFSREMLEVGGVRDIISKSGGDNSVYVSNSPNMQRLGMLYNGLLSYFLRDTDLYGRFLTANSGLDKERPDGVYRYSLLHADDNPAEYGMASAKLAWHNSLMSLYTLPAGAERQDVYHHNYRSEGTYPVVSTQQPLTVTVNASQLRLSSARAEESSSDPGNGSGSRQFSLGLAAFTTSTLRIETLDAPGGKPPVEVTVPPGYAVYRSGEVSAPAVLQLSVIPTGTTAGSIYVRWAHLEEYTGAPGREPGLAAAGPGLLAGLSAVGGGGEVRVDISYLNNRPAAISQTLSLDIYGQGRGNPSHFGYWNLSVSPATPVNLALALDPVRKSVRLENPGASIVDEFKGDTGDGNYTASLLVYENGQVSEAFNDIFTFTIENGALASVKPRSLPPLFR
jgi:hypothetical protein